MGNSSQIFNQTDKNKIISAIKEAEKNTSGEIKVHIENRCNKESLMDRATAVFSILKLHKTEQRNGVLFYLASKDRLFAILGDSGINAKVPDDFWNDVKDTVINEFKKNEFAEGLCKGIKLAGEKLAEYFPYQSDDVNELSDDISIGKK